MKSFAFPKRLPVPFRGLFWRIFLAIWLTNVAILLTVSSLLITKMEKARHDDRHQSQITRKVENMLTRYERKGKMEFRGDWYRIQQRLKDSDLPSRLALDPKNPTATGRFAIKIYNDSGLLIFERGDWQLPYPRILSFPVYSESGRQYQVECTPPGVPPFLRVVLSRFMSLQSILILIATTIASALLSWSIARPLRALGKFNREFAQEGAAMSVPTDLLARADEIGDLSRDVQYMTQQIHSTLESQQRLLHDVSHELRAPLARLQAAVALQEQSSVDHRYIEMIHRECGRISELIQRILDFSRMNQVTEQAEAINVSDLLSQCISAAQIAEPDRSYMFTQPKAPVFIDGYPSILVSAFENFIGNASKYSDALDPVEVVISVSGTDIGITIRDHGPGVNEADLGRISQPFFRAKHQHVTEGFGLGISIAQRAIEKHGGQVGFANHVDGGLVVTICLPLEPV